MNPNCESHYALVVAQLWREYIAPRFSVHERRVKARRAFELFSRRTLEIYLRYAAVGMQKRAPIEYDVHHLRALVLRALEEPCTYCGMVFGLEAFGVVERVPLGRGQAAVRALRLDNMQACCVTCAKGKELMTEGEFARVVAAVRAIAEPAVARRVMLRLAVRFDGQGTPGPAPSASNARAAGKNQAQAAKRGLSTAAGGDVGAFKRGAAGLQAIARKRAERAKGKAVARG